MSVEQLVSQWSISPKNEKKIYFGSDFLSFKKIICITIIIIDIKRK